jgi:hypothetical protein
MAVVAPHTRFFVRGLRLMRAVSVGIGFFPGELTFEQRLHEAAVRANA